jgi:hypothetical protein
VNLYRIDRFWSLELTGVILHSTLFRENNSSLFDSNRSENIGESVIEAKRVSPDGVNRNSSVGQISARSHKIYSLSNYRNPQTSRRGSLSGYSNLSITVHGKNGPPGPGGDNQLLES